jgi:uncharacterized membrane protein YphA (DoxX/SURF4 family)
MSSDFENVSEDSPSPLVRYGAAHQGLLILRLAIAVTLLLIGIDKLFGVLGTDWPKYISTPFRSIAEGPNPEDVANTRLPMFIHGWGIVEIILGLGVAFLPKIFGYIAAAGLLLLAVDLFINDVFHDVAVLYLGLGLAALALARLAQAFKCSKKRSTARV